MDLEATSNATKLEQLLAAVVALSTKLDREAPKAASTDPWTSPTIGKIAEALAKAQAKMGPAIKDKEGVIPGRDGRQGYRYGYATLAACLEVTRILNEHGIAVTQIPLDGGANGVLMSTRLIHTSGEWLRGDLWLPVVKQDAQGYGSALTYARRYGLCSLAGIAQDDDDGEASLAHQARTAPAHAPPPPPSAPAATPQETPAAKPKATRAPRQPKPDPTTEWSDGGNGHPVDPQALADRIGTVNTFPLLFALANDAHRLPNTDPRRQMLVELVKTRCVTLFGNAQNMKEVEEGIGLVNALGQPETLKQAANDAFNRFAGG